MLVIPTTTLDGVEDGNTIHVDRCMDVSARVFLIIRWKCDMTIIKVTWVLVEDVQKNVLLL